MKEITTNTIKVGMLRQWLNEDRITDTKKMITNEQIIHWLNNMKYTNLTLKKGEVRGENTPLQKMQLCLLCKEDDKNNYPQQGHSGFVYGDSKMHFTLGRTWKPEKGNKDYELHLRMLKLTNL